MPYPIADRWRARHRKRGETYRWLKAIKAPDTSRGSGAPEGGWYYVEQEVGADWRALVDQTTKAIESPEFGLIEAGATMFHVMPDEAYVGRMDRIILTQRALRGDAILTRGDTEYDALPDAPVMAITAAYAGDGPYVAGTDYVLDAGRIKWLANAPATGTKYAMEYCYNPTYTCLGAAPDRMPRPGQGGALMPLRVLLTLKAIGDD